MAPKIAYVMSRFPHLPETFILREMDELERQGWEVALYPLIEQRQAMIHSEARPWISRARAVSWLDLRTWSDNYRSCRGAPRRYVSLWGKVLAENVSSPNLLARAMVLFPKAVRMARMMEHEGVSHIHAHYATHPALVAWLISHLTGIPYSFTVHAHDIFVRTAMLKTKLQDAVFVVAISEYNRQHLTQLVGSWVKDKINIVHCGIRPDMYRPSINQGDDRFEIMNIGSLQPYKGQKYLILACAELHRRQIPFRCRIIGGGEEHPRLEQLVKELSLESSVELLEPRTQQEVAQLLPTAHCYVQPSIVTSSGKMEGIPVALMEAMACAIPCVASRLSGIPELVIEGETGWLVPAGDVSALAERLAAIYADPKGVSRVAQAGRRRVLEQFDLTANVRILAGLFEKAIGSSGISQEGRMIMKQKVLAI